MRRSTLLLLPLILLAPLTVWAQTVNLEEQQANPVASRLTGRWVLDRELSARLGEDSPRVLAVEFKDDAGWLEQLPERFAEFLAAETLYLAGTLTLELSDRRIDAPFLLIALHGAPHVVWFRERNGDPMGDTESFFVQLAGAEEPAADLLFLGGDFARESFIAFHRAN